MIGGPIVLAMVLGVLVDCCAHYYSAATWQILAVPPADDPLITQLNGLNTLWEYQLTLCTFILTFFTSQAYGHWRTVYFTTRAIQGRINDIALLLAIGAQRTLPEMAPPVAESVPLRQYKPRGQNEVGPTGEGSQVKMTCPYAKHERASRTAARITHGQLAPGRGASLTRVSWVP